MILFSDTQSAPILEKPSSNSCPTESKKEKILPYQQVIAGSGYRDTLVTPTKTKLVN